MDEFADLIDAPDKSATPLVDLPDLAQLDAWGINSSTDTSALGVKFV